MSYKGDIFTFPLIAAGLGNLRNPLVAPPGILENIRNCNLHELGLGKRGGTAIHDTMVGSDVFLQEHLSNGNFDSSDDWSRTGDFLIGGGKVNYTESGGLNKLWQAQEDFLIPLLKGQIYEFGYVVSGVSGSGFDVELGQAVTSTSLVISNGSHTARVTVLSLTEDFRITSTDGGIGDTFSLDNFTLKRVNARVTGLKQFFSKNGDRHILRATSDGKYWKDAANSIKTGLSVRGDEILSQGSFDPNDKWDETIDFNFTDNPGKATYDHSGGIGNLGQIRADFQRTLKPSTLYEFKYTVSGVSGGATCKISSSFADADIPLTISNGAQVTQFTSRSDVSVSNFILVGESDSGGDTFILDDVFLKEVIAPPVDISIYNKNAIFTNGDIPQIFTGLRFLDAPIAPVAGNAENGAGDVEDIGNDATDGTHLVKVTFHNSSGETIGSPASNTATVTDNTIDGKLKITGIPIGPNEVTGRSIYMTEADGGTTYYKVTTGAGATIGDNTTTEYEIDLDDATLVGFDEIPGDNTATTGTATTDLGSEGIELPGAPSVRLTGASACVAVRTGSAGNVDNGDHSYIIVFVDEDGNHTTSGNISNVVTIENKAVDGQVNLTEVAIGPAGTVARELYRTIAGDLGEHFEVGMIADNTTTTFTDNVADLALGSDVINNGGFSSGANWQTSSLGDFSIGAGKASYSHSGGQGQLIQKIGSMAIAPEPGHAYEFEYTVSNMVSAGNINTFVLFANQFTLETVALEKTDATHTIVVTSNNPAKVFNLLVISTGACSFDLDDLKMKEIVEDSTPIGAGDYTWKVTYENVHGETVGGVVSDTLTTTTENGNIIIENIPIGPLGVITRKIYRTDADGSTYTLLATIPDNETTTYTDKIADADLGANIPTTNTAAARPSDWANGNNPKYAFEHAVGNTEGIIFFGCENTPDQVYIIPDGTENASDVNIKQFTFKSKNSLQKNVLVGGKEYGTNLFMFSNDFAWLVDKTSLDIADWTYVKLPWKGGTISNKTLVAVNNDIHSMELDGNIYSLKRVQESGDTSIASLTRPTLTRPQAIDRWIRDNIDLSYFADFHGEFDEELQAVHWFMVRQGETEIDRALTYFVNLDRWVIQDNIDNISGFSASVSTVIINTDGTKTIYTGDYSGNVWKLNQVTRDDEGNGYWAGVKLHPTYMPQNDIVRNRSYDTLFILQEINAGVDLEVQGFVDGTSIPADSIECSTEYTRYQMGRIGRNAAVEIYNETAGDDFFINALIFYYEILDAPSE